MDINQGSFLGLKWRDDKKLRVNVGVLYLLSYTIFITSFPHVLNLPANKELGVALFATLLWFGLAIFTLLKINLKSWILWFWISLVFLFGIWMIVGIASSFF